ncbi:hypothetical protein E2562_032381 [Oryza meyeriana var. granulata]|uniref:Uncharacterized protein n=1 Tax=Oryza meyeriana var. granulata TaxID=110450 RepID=A0A6G1CAN8_9ORYZ|nr:hypothetical protein E2562_032381 [Oryza meyeriana var. granulata]
MSSSAKDGQRVAAARAELNDDSGGGWQRLRQRVVVAQAELGGGWRRLGRSSVVARWSSVVAAWMELAAAPKCFGENSSL